MNAPRVVLDTHCLVSALIFARGSCVWIREAWQAKRIIPLASRDTVSELLRVLAYPKFALARHEQETLLAEFLPYAETVTVAVPTYRLPAIRDADDLIFLALAEAGQADALISGDADLHAIKDRFRIPILTIAEFADWLQTR
ncbi:MAG: putative toxin-antitoxin system toxin component, PIN family [Rhodocyclaceae bacterium]|nr:putative toxin-antitoxin system toxin component, PIN family [Rhodocyclaceae bacterium]